jgi:MFS transporter, DHA1 family, tetracycline resistance protein
MAPEPTDPLPKSQTGTKGRNPLLALFFTIFIDLVGFSILLPVNPLLIAAKLLPNGQPSPAFKYRVIPADWNGKTGLIFLGWLLAIYPLCIFFAAPILGQLSDRVGRRPVLAISIAGTAVGYLIFAQGVSAKSIPLLFIGRAIDGLTGGNLAVAQAAIGDVSTNENRSKNFGLIGAAFGLGFILGPYIGGKLSQPNASVYGLFHTPSWFSVTTPFYFAAILAALNAIAVFLRLPETLKAKSTKQVKITQSITNVVNGFASPRLRIPLITTFFWVCGFTFFTSFFGVYVRNKFGFSQGKTGDYFAIVGIFIAITQGLIVGLVAKKLPDWKILRFAIFGQVFALSAYFLITSSSILYLFIPVLALFQGLSQANFGSLMSRSAEMGRQGEAMGIYSSVSSLAQVPASLALGYITTGLTANTPLVYGAGFTLIAGLIFLALFRPKYLMSDAPRAAAAAH